MEIEKHSMLGMYVHTNWGYNRPYAARSWTLEDWEGYLAGLKALGYGMVMIWPLLDCMPAKPNGSDRIFLALLGRVIDLAHGRYGMKVAIAAGPNVIGNEKSADYLFAGRPYFVCEKKVNPKNRREVEAFFRARRHQLEPLRKADALSIIDSDPGGYLGSTDDEFVALVKGQIEGLRSFNPQAELIYWMWCGWEAYNQWWAETAKPAAERQPVEWGGYSETLTLIREHIAEPWFVFVSWPKHFDATQTPDLMAKRIFNPYGLIECEPSFPLTNFSPQTMDEGLTAYASAPQRYPRGIMANAQTHCLQLPHTYLFAHFARGGTLANMDLERFAEEVLPGSGAVIAQGWRAIGQRDPVAQQAAAGELRTCVGRAHQRGRLSGLLFGDADRFLTDLIMNLDLRAGLTDMKAEIDGQGKTVVRAVRRVLDSLCPYQQRLGFVDSYYGPLEVELNGELKRINHELINAVLEDFHEWHNPTLRNGIVPRLLEAMGAYCREQGG